MASKQADFEKQVVTLIRARLVERRNEFAKAGLRPDLSERTSGELSDDMEISVYFWRGDDVADVIEFHIYRKGQRVAELNEIDAWFDSQLNVLLARPSPHDKSN